RQPRPGVLARGRRQRHRRLRRQGHPARPPPLTQVAEQPWRGTPLPPGRHKLPRSEVRASQRERLMRAMLEEVGAHGYAGTTVPSVIAAARVSRNAFYALFKDKLDCFLALCDEEAVGLFDASTAGAAEPAWRDAVRLGVEG